MAHAVETMFSVRSTPWHGLGKVIQSGKLSLSEGMRESGLDWDVETTPLFCQQNIPHANGYNSVGMRDISEFGSAVRRTSDGSILGVVGSDWKPLQNSDAFKFFQPYLDTGMVELATAGSLHRGRVIWILAEITAGGPLQITKDGSDTIRKFLLLSNAHDGSRSVRVGFTPIRVVCANTLAMSDSCKNAESLRIRHTAGMHKTLAAVRDTINLVNQQFEATATQYRYLATRKINQNDLRNYVKIIISADPAYPTRAEDKAIDDVVGRALNGYGQESDNLTAWSAYNGVTEFLSYATNHRTIDTRIGSLWFGENARKNLEAFTAALAL